MDFLLSCNCLTMLVTEWGTSFNLSIFLTSLHGLVRGENMELGRDSDTGGQVNLIIFVGMGITSFQIAFLSLRSLSESIQFSD